MADVDDWGRRSVAVLPQAIDTSAPAIARVYDYLLCGKDHFAADRELADQLVAVDRAARLRARENRKFLERAVRFLADDARVRQFLDIGIGYPAGENVHDIAQAADPSARVVYVDNDPLVLAHARALLASHPDPRVACLA